MPPPSEAKLGTRVHQTERYPEDDDELEVEKCEGCRHFFPIKELDEEGFCDECSQEGSGHELNE
jgi:hypothetical protein